MGFARGVDLRRPYISSAMPSWTLTALALLATIYVVTATMSAAWRTVEGLDTFVLSAVACTLAVIIFAARFGPRGDIFSLLIVSFCAQCYAGVGLDQDLYGELNQQMLRAHGFANDLSNGGVDWSDLREAASPIATVFYGSLIFLFEGASSPAAVSGEDASPIREIGDVPTWLRAVSAALWTAQIWLIWRVAREISELREHAVVVAVVFGLSPALILFGPVPSVEALFGVFALLSLYFMLSQRRRGLLLSAFLSGGAAAIAFLTHPIGLAHTMALIGLMVFAFFAARVGRGRILLALMVFVIGAGLGYAPRIYLNYKAENIISASPGHALSSQVLFGLSQARPGAISRKQRNNARFEAEKSAGLAGASGEELVAAESRAWKLARQDCSANPVGIGKTALIEKTARFWESEADILTWNGGASVHSTNGLLVAYAPDIAQGAFIGILLAATLGIMRLTLRRGAVRDPARWFLVIGAILTLAVTAAIFDTPARHHLVFAPLFALLAPLAFIRLPFIAATAARSERAAQAPAELVEAAAEAPPPPPPPKNAPATERLAAVLQRMSKPPSRNESRESGQSSMSEMNEAAAAEIRSKLKLRPMSEEPPRKRGSSS